MRCAPWFQLVMMPSSVLLMTASSADSIIAVSQYGASSGLARFVKSFVETLEVFSSEGLLPISGQILVLSKERQRGLRGARIIARRNGLRSQSDVKTHKNNCRGGHGVPPLQL